MYRLATMHSVTDGQTDRQTDTDVPRSLTRTFCHRCKKTFTCFKNILLKRLLKILTRPTFIY